MMRNSPVYMSLLYKLTITNTSFGLLLRELPSSLRRRRAHGRRRVPFQTAVERGLQEPLVPHARLQQGFLELADQTGLINRLVAQRRGQSSYFLERTPCGMIVAKHVVVAEGVAALHALALEGLALRDAPRDLRGRIASNLDERPRLMATSHMEGTATPQNTASARPQ